MTALFRVGWIHRHQRFSLHPSCVPCGWELPKDWARLRLPPHGRAVSFSVNPGRRTGRPTPFLAPLGTTDDAGATSAELSCSRRRPSAPGSMPQAARRRHVPHSPTAAIVANAANVTRAASAPSSASRGKTVANSVPPRAPSSTKARPQEVSGSAHARRGTVEVASDPSQGQVGGHVDQGRRSGPTRRRRDRRRSRVDRRNVRCRCGVLYLLPHALTPSDLADANRGQSGPSPPVASSQSATRSQAASTSSSVTSSSSTRRRDWRASPRSRSCSRRNRPSWSY